MGSAGSMFNTAFSAIGALQGSGDDSSAFLKARLEADNLESQAARKELEAREALKVGTLKQAEQKIKGRREIAEQRVKFAAGGVKVNEGSAVEVAADKAAWSEYERQKIEYAANMESWGLKYDAALLRKKASTTLTTGVAGSGSGSDPASSFAAFGKQAMGALKTEGLIDA